MNADDVLGMAEAVGIELEPWQRETIRSIYAVPPDEFRHRLREALDPLAASAKRAAAAMARMADAWRLIAAAMQPYAVAAERRRLRLRRMHTQYRRRRKGRW